MQILKLSKRGTEPATAYRTLTKSGKEFYRLTHGEEGRGRWQIRFPLAVREFPSPAEHGDKLELNGEYKLIDLERDDPRGNPLHLIANGEADGKQLILWSLSPGFRGGASWKVSGSATILCRGEEAQGDAGRMGGADCPVILVEGPCTLAWTRTGRLYDDPADWVAKFDGEDWLVSPVTDGILENAVVNY